MTGKIIQIIQSKYFKTPPTPSLTPVHSQSPEGNGINFSVSPFLHLGFFSAFSKNQMRLYMLVYNMLFSLKTYSGQFI